MPSPEELGHVTNAMQWEAPDLEPEEERLWQEAASRRGVQEADAVVFAFRYRVRKAREKAKAPQDERAQPPSEWTFWGIRYGQTGGWQSRGLSEARARMEVAEWRWHRLTPVRAEPDPDYLRDLRAEGSEPHPPIGSPEWEQHLRAKKPLR